jgi:spore coat polysaccharide biosynthesis predicted glycosyltransferase SpsG
MIKGPVTAIFRAEASAEFGLGHMMRCLALAEELSPDSPSVFVLTNHAAREKATAPLAEKGWIIHALPSGADGADDAGNTVAIAQEVGAGVVVTDLCHRGNLAAPWHLAEYHRELRKAGAPFILSIEDCRMDSFSSDMAVVPYDCDGCDLDQALSDGCRMLAGLRYYVARREFSAAACQGRDIRTVGRRVMVSIGGGDPTGLTAKVTRALFPLVGDGIEARIFIGNAMSDSLADETAAICGESSRLEARPFTDRLADELMWADLAIIGEGLVRFEAAITGTPSLTISQLDHDSDVLRDFFDKGTTRYIGRGEKVTETEIAQQVTRLLNDAAARRAQSAAGKALLDGGGALRIAEAVLPLLH